MPSGSGRLSRRNLLWLAGLSVGGVAGCQSAFGPRTTATRATTRTATPTTSTRPPEPTAQFLAADAERTTPDIGYPVVADLVRGHTGFAVDLHRRLVAGGQRGNLVTAPYGVALGLEMAYGGALGPLMPAALDRDDANFSGMYRAGQTARNVAVDAVGHGVYISVGEQGLGGGEATEEMGVRLTEHESLVADRPSLLYLQHRGTGAVLCLGRVVDAAAAQP